MKSSHEATAVHRLGQPAVSVTREVASSVSETTLSWWPRKENRKPRVHTVWKLAMRLRERFYTRKLTTRKFTC